ncbi:regulator of telomere elongation helicase 1 isoform X1 [Nematostella vectensis]|uniref:regulator of telomere elongation helicase 1 isoform X1 n=1 Tax=Nematostella vectensis TaxID=45351 RepID=UPI00139021CC|nr:regulator of telomere elongation helicase 1 isoform X1 [Nematostella vectensis]
MVVVRKVDVDFPFKPYDCQVAYMEKVIECLQTRKNAVLESPTGTGKTLCLLCATLAWRQSYVANLQLQQRGLCAAKEEEDGFQKSLGNKLAEAASGTWDDSCSNKGSNFEIPKIIYASRTHSQLSQAVQELKATVYRPRVSIIGSREQLCINSDVLKQDSNSAKVHMCRAKVTARTCHFYNNLEGNKSNPAFTTEILDIEDLVRLGQKHKVCPYYMARELKTSADIIFMPYNYLLDPKSRKAHNLDISGSIVVFDEAHNLEKVCEETVSFDLTSFDIASCVEDVLLCMEYVANAEDDPDIGEGASGTDIDPEDLKVLKALFSKLEEEIDQIQLPSDGSKSFPGDFMFELLGNVGIKPNTKDRVLETLEKINTLLANDTKGLRGKHFALQKFTDALQIVFNKTDKGPKSGNSFKVHVQVEPDSKKKQKGLDIWTSGSKLSKKGRTLSYWCFSPGHAMKDLMSQGVSSVILTSGTLSPLNSFTAEMQIPFPIRLENPHVIEKHQMMVAVVTKAPDGATLNSSYEFRSTPGYMTGLGNTIANFARTIPNGLLVFFPSYPVMNKCLEHWQNTGIWARLSQYKPMFAEPRGKGDFVQTMEDFYAKINDPSLNGATFFAVCRGKVSEGLDFSDINGRAVVITGLPFPPMMDAKVKLKMSFLDEMSRKDKSAIKGLTGREWYRQQASRAVNQAVGRVIRHRQDFGAILLCDVRFTYPDALRELPSWVKPQVKIFKEFGHVQRELIQFFRKADIMVDKSAMKVRQPRDLEKSDPSPTSAVRTTEPEESRIDVFVPAMFREKPKKPSHRLSPPARAVRSQASSASGQARMTVEYETPTLRTPTLSAPPPRPQGNLLESLKSSEGSMESTSNDSPLRKHSSPSLSDAIMRTKGTTNTSHKPKKVFKIVKTKSESAEENSKAQKLEAAKMYIVKVKQSLSGENYKAFSRVLANYKQCNDLDQLISGLTLLFTQNRSLYPLFLGFSNYIRDPQDKKRLFEAYKEITGEDVPASYLSGLPSRKRAEPDFIHTSKVGKKMRMETDVKSNYLEKSALKEKVPKAGSWNSAASASNHLDAHTHLNGGQR